MESLDDRPPPPPKKFRLPTKWKKRPVIEAQVSPLSPKCECGKNCLMNKQELMKKGINPKESLLGSSPQETKNLLLTHLKAQTTVLGKEGDGEVAFIYHGLYFCKTAFANLLGVSYYTLQVVLTAYSQGLDYIIHGNSGNKRTHPNKVKAVCWFKSFCSIFGQWSSDDMRVNLPSWLNKTSVYKMYEDENPISSERIKFSTFCNMIREDFGGSNRDRTLPHVRFSKYSSHSVCNICSDLEIFRRTCKSQYEFELYTALKLKHKERYSKQRRFICALTQHSITFPDQQVTLMVDGMDNWKVRRISIKCSVHIPIALELHSTI